MSPWGRHCRRLLLLLLAMLLLLPVAPPSCLPDPQDPTSSDSSSHNDGDCSQFDRLTLEQLALVLTHVPLQQRLTVITDQGSARLALGLLLCLCVAAVGWSNLWVGQNVSCHCVCASSGVQCFCVACEACWARLESCQVGLSVSDLKPGKARLVPCASAVQQGKAHNSSVTS